MVFTHESCLILEANLAYFKHPFEANTFERSLHGRFMSEQQMLINGEWVNGENGETSDVINPATGAVIATVPRAYC